MPDEPYPPPRLVTTIAVIDLLKTALRAGGLVGVVYFGLAVPIRETAGQETGLTVVYRAVVDMKMHAILPYAAAVGAILAWWKERRTRIVAVERENRRNRELEKQLDPGRTSSGPQETRRQTKSSGGA